MPTSSRPQYGDIFGQTALYDAIAKALERIEQHSMEKKVLVVISDGADNASAHSLEQVLQMAERSSAIIYTVGRFAPDDQDANIEALARLAQATGGEAFFPGRPSAVTEICERIARDIRNQYTIGYVPTNGEAGRRLSRRSSNRSCAGSRKAFRPHACRLYPSRAALDREAATMRNESGRAAICSSPTKSKKASCVTMGRHVTLCGQPEISAAAPYPTPKSIWQKG